MTPAIALQDTKRQMKWYLGKGAEMRQERKLLWEWINRQQTLHKTLKNCEMSLNGLILSDHTNNFSVSLITINIVYERINTVCNEDDVQIVIIPGTYNTSYIDFNRHHEIFTNHRIMAPRAAIFWADELLSHIQASADIAGLHMDK